MATIMELIRRLTVKKKKEVKKRKQKMESKVLHGGVRHFVIRSRELISMHAINSYANKVFT